jgi:hypothetical protein
MFMSIVPLKPTTFRLETEIMEALVAIRVRDGIPVSEQMRRALKAWITERGVSLRPASIPKPLVRPRVPRPRKKRDA